jgi:hypothetical protein
MVKHRFALSAIGMVVLCAASAASLHGDTFNRTAYLTFSAPVALPGVGLAPGTYIFELAAPATDLTLVRVFSRNRSKVYFMGFTEIISRPPDVPADRPVSLGEAPRGVPPPITAWYLPDGSTGRRFIYRESDRTVNQRAGR